MEECHPETVALLPDYWCCSIDGEALYSETNDTAPDGSRLLAGASLLDDLHEVTAEEVVNQRLIVFAEGSGPRRRFAAGTHPLTVVERE